MLTPYEHYAYWERELGRMPFPMGQFGANPTVTGLLKAEVRIGDVFRFGNTVLQAVQPRIPCAKLNQRMGLRFSPMFLASCKLGYYLRVLREGDVGENDSIELLERDQASPTRDEFVRLTQYEYWGAEGLARVLHQARDLVPAWREIIEAKLSRAQSAVGWHGLREIEIVRREEESDDVVSLYVKCGRGRPLAPFRGGQFLTVVLGGRSAHQHRRAYAISSSPQDLSAYRITVRHLHASGEDCPEGIVSSRLVSPKVGGHILCLAPPGALTQGGSEDRIPVLVSRGLGIAPMVSILHQLEEQKVPAACLIHESSDRDPQLLVQEAAALVHGKAGCQMICTEGRAVPQTAQIRAMPVRLSAERIGTHVPLERADFYLAGPRRLIDRLVDDLSAAGVPSTALHTENFG